MCDFTKCHQVAMRKVVDAIRLMRDGNGSTKQDIYFVLDNLHGRVQRHVIKHAINSAVDKGLINRKNNRYKVRRTRKNTNIARKRTMPGCAVRSSGRRMARVARPSRVFRDTTRARSCYQVPVRVSKSRASRSRTYAVRSRKSDCSSVSARKSYAGRSRKSESTISEITSCSGCCSCMSASTISSESSCSTVVEKPKRKPAKRNPKKKYPMPKVMVKVEKNQSRPAVQKEKNTEVEKQAEGNKPEEAKKPRGILKGWFQGAVEQAKSLTSSERLEEDVDAKVPYFTRSKARSEKEGRSARSVRSGRTNKTAKTSEQQKNNN